MLRTNVSGKRLFLLWLACGAVGALAAALVAFGNPGNMGLCGACFLRDISGALGLFAGDGPRIFRPEIAGIVLGAFALRLGQQKFEGRAGSFAGPRFVLGVFMGIGALVFLGCPFRMLQRLGGGDLNGVVGLGGFIAGVGAGLFFERRGYTAGKTAPVMKAAGLPAIILVAGLLALFLLDALPYGPGPGDADTPPPHAPWMIALGIALVAGALLSLTGFCAVSAARQVFIGPRRMLAATVVLIAGYAIVSVARGSFALSFENQPIAHSEHLWNVLAMALVGLTGVMAGGCPVRQVVLSGEGNGDAMVTAAGILAGGALAHSMGLASTPAGTTEPGRIAVIAGLALCLAYAIAISRANRIKAHPEAT
jgi:YedE family putative selenium metabolism protein